jgi:transcriptional regulator with XRE-family HTH domain
MLDNAVMKERIRTAIEASDHSQASIAAAFGVTEQAVSGWIRTGKIDKRKLPKLAKLTGRSLNYFMPDALRDNGFAETVANLEGTMKWWDSKGANPAPGEEGRVDFAAGIERAQLADRLSSMMKMSGLDEEGLSARAEVPASFIRSITSQEMPFELVPAVAIFRLAHAVDLSGYELLTGGREVVEESADTQSQPVQLDRWKLAFQLVADFLDTEELMLPPAKHAEVTLLVHDLLLEGLPRAKVLQFVRAAAA